MRLLNRFHLNGLKAVEAVARLGTLATAAEELGVSPGAVSQQIIRAERIAGRALFVRRTAGLTPLASASPFFSRLHLGFRNLVAAVETLEEHSRSRLTVSVAPVFAAKWLVPRLGRFQALHPDLHILVDADVALVDFDRSDVDVAIRVGKGPWPSVRAEPLIEQVIFPVCSPSMAAELSSPEDLTRVPIIRDVRSDLSWQLWLEPFLINAELLGAGPSYSDAALCLDAAIAGQGVFLAWPTLASDALRERRIVRPFTHEAATGARYWLVTSASQRPEAKARLFGEWLKGELNASLQSIEADRSN
jgi:LysR family transcriptional regulator, glycine cleavage system transcriptional activator